MTFSAAAAATPRSWRIPSQHWVRHDRPHRNTTRDPPAAWFLQICYILGDITLFLQCKFCYTATIMRRSRVDWISVIVSWFLKLFLCHASRDITNLLTSLLFPLWSPGWAAHEAFVATFHRHHQELDNQPKYGRIYMGRTDKGCSFCGKDHVLWLRTDENEKLYYLMEENISRCGGGLQRLADGTTMPRTIRWCSYSL